MVEEDQLGGGPVDIHGLAAQGPWDLLVCATTQSFFPEAEKGKARPQTISLPSPPCNLL